MVTDHWQIMKNDDSGKRRYGRTETLPVQQAPRQVISTARSAANLIGDGLYGVDIKQSGRPLYIIEVNDNPNIDAGVEDDFLKNELYTPHDGGFSRTDRGNEGRQEDFREH